MAKVGYYIDEQGNGNFRIFAPYCNSLAIELDSNHARIELTKQKDGYFTTTIQALPEDTLYWLVKDNELHLPDPYSKYQPFDVHSTSMITFPQKADFTMWHGIKYEDAIIYEMHIGTFSEEGTFLGACKHLQHLRSLGINVIELMPICEFPGDHNWGYDGTYMYAINQSYGKYEDLKKFLDEAHKMGMAVILDIVYNHFGPEGNYTGVLAPFTQDANTPWGAAINFDGEYSYGIREYYLENIKYWLSDVGFDGFRMDAVALVLDHSPKHILREINELVDQIRTQENRSIIMIAEHLRNEAIVTADDGYKFDGQWCDDLNYAIYAYLTPDRFRHYADFGSIDDILKSLEKGFVYDGTKHNSVYDNYMGCDGSTIPPAKLVVHMQNHDQIGNRPKGDRLSTTYGINKALLATTMMFASPYTPMIFQGEEYAEMNPFYFFTSFKDRNLQEAVKQGRSREFSFAPDVQQKDPNDIQTFIDSKLDWDCVTDIPHRSILEFYKRLIALKKAQIIGPHNHQELHITFNQHTKLLVIEAPKSITVCNLSDQYVDLDPQYNEYKLLLSSKIEGSTFENKIESHCARIYTKNFS